MTSDSFVPYTPEVLPPAVALYLDPPQGDRSSVWGAFRDDAEVTDEGHTYSGRDAIQGWLATAASQYTYTTTLTGQRRESTGLWVVLARLEGNFPGGVADLRFTFEMHGDLICRLVIAP